MEIKIVEQPWLMSVSVYIFEKGYKPSIAHYKDGRLEMSELVEGEIDPEPTLKLPYEVWDCLKHQLIDNKVRDKNEVEAELGATRYHLEDMRKLLKIDKS